MEHPPFSLRPPSLVDERVARTRRRERAKARAAETRQTNAVRHAPPLPPSDSYTPGIGDPGRSSLYAGYNPADTPGITPVPAWGEDAVPVITLLNQKGGVGKSSTCHHVAGTLAKMGRRCLLLDNDPQSSLSQGFWGPIAARQIDPAETMAALYAGYRPFPEQVIKPTGIEGIDLVPGSRHATDYNVPRPYEADHEVQTCIRDFLAGARESYHAVLIDCPPNLHMASWAALVASDFIVVPISPEDYASQGLVDVQESIAMVRSMQNPGLELLGYLLTMVQPRRTIHQLYEERLRALYGADVFAARVPESVDYVEAIARRMPIAQYKPKGAGAKAIQAVATELEARVKAKLDVDRTEAA